MKPASGRLIGILLLAIFAAGAAIRLYFLIRYGSAITLGSDDWGYRDSALALAKTGILTYNYPGPTVFIMPAYPAFLALMFRFFGTDAGEIAARALQIAVSLGGIWFLWLISRRMIRNIYIALIPIVSVMFYPPAVMAPNLLLTETWYASLLLVCAYVSIRFIEKPTLKMSLTLGFSFAAAAYFHPAVALLPVFVSAVMFFKWSGTPFRRRLAMIAAAALVMALCLSPWWIRNVVVFHEFIPFTDSAGNPLLYGSYINYEGIVDGDNPEWPTATDGREANRLQQEMALERIKDGFQTNPTAYVKWYVYGKYEYFWKYPFDWFTVSEFPSAFNIGYHYFLLFTGAAGIIVWGIRKKKGDHGVAVTFLIYGTLVYLPFVVSARYAYPLMFILAVFTGILADGALQVLQKRSNSNIIGVSQE